MRYKRYRRGRSSRVIRMKFQSFVDISTQADNMQIISVNAGGRDVVKRLAPFFGAYKYYKLGSVSIKLIPASTLPVDPTGLSYDEDDFQTVDPRDQLTPGMCRITNGEDILENITGLTGDEQRQLYDNMILDTRWFKWMLQSGVKRSGRPKYWQIGQLHQDKWPGIFQNYPVLAADSDAPTGTGHTIQTGKTGVSPDIGGAVGLSGSSAHGLFQTGHRGVLGWLPTDGLSPMWNSALSKVNEVPMIAAVPEIELFKILTPPMRKTNYYYRMFITETVYFKDPIVMNVNGYRPVDVFHVNYVPATASPIVPQTAGTTPNDGGNDGSS